MEKRTSVLEKGAYVNVIKINLTGSYQDTLLEGYAKIHYDDSCNNGHNTFSITGDWYDYGKVHTDRNMYSCGCTHEIILELAKETEHYEFLKNAVKFHLVSTDEPLHYFANTMYLVSNKDCNGRLKGEACSWDEKLKIKNFPFSKKLSSNLSKFLKETDRKTIKSGLEIEELPHDREPKTYSANYTFKELRTSRWYDCPFNSLADANEFRDALLNYDWYIAKIITGYSKGKERDLSGARECALWEDATIEQLESKEALTEHLKEVMEEFYNFITIDCKFVY